MAALRDTQNYVQLAARGLTLWDVRPSSVRRDLEQWAPLQAWLGLPPTPVPAPEAAPAVAPA